MIGCARSGGVMYVRPSVCQSGESSYLLTPQTITMSDISQITWLIVMVWAVAWAIRMVINTVWTSRNLGGRHDAGD